MRTGGGYARSCRDELPSQIVTINGSYKGTQLDAYFLQGSLELFLCCSGLVG